MELALAFPKLFETFRLGFELSTHFRYLNCSNNNTTFQPVEGMLSHQLEQNRIDGEKTIIQNPSEAQRKEHDKFDFSVHEVYAVDVLISSGEGLGRERDAKITIYKKTDDTYMLKMKTSREFYSKVRSHAPFHLPFTIFVLIF